MAAERTIELDVFGGRSRIAVEGRGADGRTPELALARAAAVLRRAHAVLTRFDAGSELSRLNADPRPTVRTHPWVAELAAAVRHAGELSGGLVDGTLLEEINAAGYHATLDELPAAPPAARAAGHAPARPHPAARWQLVEALVADEVVIRPPGVQLDGGGLVKGLAVDRVARMLAGHARFSVDCSGDLRVGGTRGDIRQVAVGSPWDGEAPIWSLALAHGALATSGTTRRTFARPDGTAGHHLLDPSTGRPADTGLVQVTARASTALEAEVRAKAALLSGPGGAAAHLPDGGVVVADDRRVSHLPAHAHHREVVAA